MGGHRADLRQQHAEARIALEEVLDGEVERARVRVLLLDRLGDHRRVGRQRAGVVGDQQRAALGRHVLDPLDLAAEPQLVEELDQRAVHEALDALRAPPVVDLALGLDARQVGAQVGARSGLAGGGERACRRSSGHLASDHAERRTRDHAARRSARQARLERGGQAGPVRRRRRPRLLLAQRPGSTGARASRRPCRARSRAPRVTGLSSMRTSMSSSHAAADLVVGAVQVVVLAGRWRPASARWPGGSARRGGW